MLVDASPLIYLAKIDALSVFEASGHVPLITKEVQRETARPGLAYQHPDSLLIAEAIRSGLLRRTDLSQREMEVAERLLKEAGGIGSGEAEVLAAATERSLPALLSERRASGLAKSIGIETFTPIDLTFSGTAQRALLVRRIRQYAELVEMRMLDLEALMQRIEEWECD